MSFKNGKSGVIEDFKKRKKKILIKNIIIIVKIYPGIYQEVLQAVWVQFSFR